MHRRRLLGASGTLFVLSSMSGCLGSNPDDGGTVGNDDRPLSADDPESLLLSTDGVETHLAEGWSEETPEIDALFRDADAVREYVPYSEESGFHMESGTVESGVWAFEGVDGARTFYDEHPYQEGWGLESGDIAVESIAGTGAREALYCVLFRDANVVGGIRYENGRLDEQSLSETALNLAATMHEGWRSPAE